MVFVVIATLQVRGTPLPKSLHTPKQEELSDSDTPGEIVHVSHYKPGCTETTPQDQESSQGGITTANTRCLRRSHLPAVGRHNAHCARVRPTSGTSVYASRHWRRFPYCPSRTSSAWRNRTAYCSRITSTSELATTHLLCAKVEYNYNSPYVTTIAASRTTSMCATKARHHCSEWTS